MKNLLFITAMLLMFSSAQAQMNTSGTVGLTTFIGQDQFGIRLPIWLGDNFVLAPSFGAWTQTNEGTDFLVGLMPKFYLKTERLSPYLGFNIGARFRNKHNDQVDYSRTSVTTSIVFGGEYFLSNSFSLGVEAQGNFLFSNTNDDGNRTSDGSTFNLTTVATASVYF